MIIKLIHNTICLFKWNTTKLRGSRLKKNDWKRRTPNILTRGSNVLQEGDEVCPPAPTPHTAPPHLHHPIILFHLWPHPASSCPIPSISISISNLPPPSPISPRQQPESHLLDVPRARESSEPMTHTCLLSLLPPLPPRPPIKGQPRGGIRAESGTDDGPPADPVRLLGPKGIPEMCFTARNVWCEGHCRLLTLQFEPHPQHTHTKKKKGVSQPAKPLSKWK